LAHQSHSMFRAGFRALVAGVLVLFTASSAFAEDDVSGPPVAPTSSLMACVTACGKLAKDNKTSPELLARCPMSGIPECVGLKFEEQVAIENACLNCGNFSDEVRAAVALALKEAEAKEAARLDAEAKAKAAAKASRPAPRPRSAQQVCEQDKKSKWISAPVLDKEGNPTGKTQLRCFTLADAHDLLEKLEREGRLPPHVQDPRIERKDDAPATPSPETAPNAPVAPAAPALTPEEREQLKAAEVICRRRSGEDPKLSLKERSEDICKRLEEVESAALRAHGKLNRIVESRPHLWFSMTGNFHFMRSVYQRAMFSVGPEAMWSPPGITRFVRLHFFLGFGGGNAVKQGGLPVLWGGGGVARMLDNDELVGALIASFEKRFSDDPQQASVCYGGGPQIVWMPGAVPRKPDAWVPIFGARGQLGPCRETNGAGKLVTYFNPIWTIHVGAGF
jgi:hypothetical protein